MLDHKISLQQPFYRCGHLNKLIKNDTIKKRLLTSFMVTRNSN